MSLQSRCYNQFVCGCSITKLSDTHKHGHRQGSSLDTIWQWRCPLRVIEWLSLVKFITAKAIRNVGVCMNFLIFHPCLPCFLYGLGDIWCQRPAYCAISACDCMKICTVKVAFSVWICKSNFIHACTVKLIFRKERRSWCSLCRMSHIANCAVYCCALILCLWMK